MTPIASYRTNAINDGYVYECSCGALYNNVLSAETCRKCRTYCPFGYCTHVVDIRSGAVVAGKEPTTEEWEVMTIRMEARLEEERAEYEFQSQMWRQEGALYDAEMERQLEAAHIAEVEASEDAMWAIQDRLMGIRAAA